MSHSITAKELQEIKSLLLKGRYVRKGTGSVHVEFLALSFAKYILFSDIESWRKDAKKPFKDCPLKRGQRIRAMHYLIEKRILIFDNNRRTRANNFAEKVNQLEKKIKEKKKKDGN